MAARRVYFGFAAYTTSTSDGLESVSYTHLDVYKRQLTGSGGKLDVEEARKSYSAYLDTLTDAPEKNMVWSVSYTHLDVYKRQMHESGCPVCPFPRCVRRSTPGNVEKLKPV